MEVAGCVSAWRSALNAGGAVDSRASMVNAGIITRKDFRQLRNILDSLMNKQTELQCTRRARGAQGVGTLIQRHKTFALKVCPADRAPSCQRALAAA